MGEAKDRLGATGLFPYGRLNPDDEGQLRMAVGVKQGPLGKVVVIDFGKPVTWLGLPVKEARELVGLILRHVKTIEEET